MSINSCCKLWELLEFGEKVKHKHLLWGLMFLRLYENIATLSTIAKCCPKTYRKWVKIVIKVISTKMHKVVSDLIKFVFCKTQTSNLV